MRRHRFQLGVIGMAGAALAGCGTPAGVMFERSGPAPVWPAAPDEPRVKYVGELRTSEDLRAGKSFGKGLGEFLFGKDDAYGMLSPMAVCTDANERVFVADSNAQTLHVFDLRARTYGRWAPASSGEQAPGFGQPVAVTYDAVSERVLVSDSVGRVVEAFGMDGAHRGSIGAGVLERPCGVAVEPGTGRVFVVDVTAHQVVVFDRGGAEVARLGGRGSGPGLFNFPTNIAFTPGGDLVVSDTLNFRLQVLRPDGTFVRQIGRKGDLPGYFSQPKGVGVDSEGNILAVDANFEAVQFFNGSGELLMSMGGEGQGPGEFWLPAGIWVEATGRVWVADSYNKRVQVFELLREGSAP